MSFTSLNAESREFRGVRLIKSTYTRIELSGKVVESAVIDGFQNTPASSYHDGVDVAMIRYHSKALGIKDGVYKLRVKSKAKIKEIGLYKGIAELYTKDSKVIYSGTHAFDVFSVELPASRGVRDVATRINNFQENLVQHTFDDHLEFTINYCCKNGTCGTCIGPACPN
jgi:hypothetical protein